MNNIDEYKKIKVSNKGVPNRVSCNKCWDGLNGRCVVTLENGKFYSNCPRPEKEAEWKIYS